MKVNYLLPVKGLTGKKDGLVYYIDKESGQAYCRDYVVPEESESNVIMKSRSANIGLFYHAVSEGYIRDLKNYCDRYNLMRIGMGGRLNSNSALIKMMYKLKKGVPAVDLTTITPADIVAADLPIRTVMEAVDSGLLTFVKRYEELTSWII
ncbi:MAG: hypothetical protein P9L91_02490 [Candidatus Zophobacter franzmannii]|nr:hypothetical protein [Candidatus Zophobacter franzmannii]